MTQPRNTIEIVGNSQPWEAMSSEQFRRLLDISTKLSSTLDHRQLLQMVIDTATDLTSTEHASILLMDQASAKLHIAATTGLEPADDAVVPLEGSMAGWILRRGQPLIIDDVNQESLAFRDIVGAGSYTTRNLLGVPMITKERVIGVLEVINKQHGETYSQQDVIVLEALASQAAVAIENARLFLQTDLIAEFMHELKTPLMALTAASELLNRENLGEKALELVDMIQRETMRLAKMAQEFLDLARLESGRTQLAQQIVDIDDLVNDVANLQAAQAEVYQISLKTELPNDLPTISADYDRLKQVLLNLTSNAIKYNREGGQVAIAVQNLGPEIVIEIRDTGPGIAKENLHHLFERFYRIPDNEGFTKGTGLGLSIAARILQEHGGRIEVDSVLGQGSTFRCFLPAKRE